MFDKHNLALKRPFIRHRNQGRSHWIFAHVIPFLRIALAVANNVIEETALPKTGSAASDGGSYNAFQSANPDAQIEIIATTHKQADVVRHNHIATQYKSTGNAKLAVLKQRGMHGFGRKDFTPSVCTKSHKIKRRIIFLKYAFQTRRFSETH